MKEQHYKTI